MKENLRVLILEDIPSDAELAKKELTVVLENFISHVVDTEKDFIHALETFKPDLIISDYKLPAFDGLSALQIIRQKFPFIPFIVLTGSMNEDTAVECMKAGADDYVIKEHIKRLGSAVRSAINRKKMEQEHDHALQCLRESEEKYRTLVSHIPGVVWTADHDGITKFISRNVKDILGLTPEAFLHKTESILFSRIHPDDIAKVKKAFELLVDKNRMYDIEFRLQKMDGEWIWVLDRSIRTYKKNDKIYADSIFFDITERKKAEEKIRKLNEELEHRVNKRTAELETVNQELKEFAYVVSHDLKAPLRAVSQLSTWIHKDYQDILDKTGKEYLDLMVKRVKRMDLLINGILEYSRIGRVENEQEEIVLTKLVDEVIESLAPPHHMKIHVEKTLPVIYGSRIRIMQLFQNLINNAIKYIDKPQGLIQITCNEKDDKWLFSVADNGPGINRKYYKRIFTLFQTLQARDKVEATGIGLTLVKKIIENSGGKIWVDSEIGKGSTFHFTWPK